MDTNINNRKGNGIFLGIVSVATLIVAIMGATFAYFSASTESADNAVNLGAYEFKLTLDVEEIYPKDMKALIPLNARQELVLDEETGSKTTYLEYALNMAEKKCIDDQGLQVCTLYKVTIYNQAANEVTLTGQIKTISNNPGEDENSTGFLNLTYQELAGDHEQFNMSLVGDPIKLNHDVEGTVPIGSVTVEPATINPDTGEVIEEGVGSTYVLIYLNENGDQSSEMGSTYTGQLIYTSGSGDTGNTLTGRFEVKGPTTEEEETTEDPEGTE